MSATQRTDAVDMLLKSTKCLALELHESIHETHSKHVMAVITELAQVQEENKRLRELLKPLAELDLTGVNADIVYARNHTYITLIDCQRAKEALNEKY